MTNVPYSSKPSPPLAERGGPRQVLQRAASVAESPPLMRLPRLSAALDARDSPAQNLHALLRARYMDGLLGPLGWMQGLPEDFEGDVRALRDLGGKEGRGTDGLWRTGVQTRYTL